MRVTVQVKLQLETPMPDISEPLNPDMAELSILLR